MLSVDRNRWMFIALVLLSILCYSYIAYYLDRRNFYEILLAFTTCFTAYFYVVKKAPLTKMSLFSSLGILFRMLFLLSIPTLSDDYFRFIWDGQILANELNPFDLLPTEVSAEFPNKEELLRQMNSPEYYTVYPPVAQLIYYLGALISPNSVLGSVLVMRSIILLAEIGTIALLPKLLQLLNFDPRNALLYTLNPLVIVELSGNLHFEGILIFFFLLALYLVVLHRGILASIAWALAAATKLLPIFFLPILFRKYPFKQLIPIYAIFGILFLVLWIPFYNESMIEHFTSSINLYYATFEFNASVYYLVRWVGYQLVDYNVIGTVGPWLSRLAMVLMFLILIRKKNAEWKHFFPSLLFALSIYYLFALIVHPWYCCFLVFLAVFTNYRYAIAWSALIVLSYWAYGNPGFEENYWLLTLEYLLVILLFLREYFGKKISLLSLAQSS